MTDPVPDMPAPASEGWRSVAMWLLKPRASESGGRLVVRYAGGIVLLWLGLAVFGIGIGFGTVGSGDNPEVAFAGLGLGVICTFVAWFAVNPAVVADRTGIALSPLFGTTTTFGWGEVRSIGVRDVRAARGRGPALVVDATDDREARIDSLWVGATRTALVLVAERLEAFVAMLDVLPPRFETAPFDGEDGGEGFDDQNENTF